ncbi:MAG: GAF domain-containing protein [Deltaproteobacteria bacterium]|nr:GAF domain-containing protein [Deltaproteobacteria bacterium]
MSYISDWHLQARLDHSSRAFLFMLRSSFSSIRVRLILLVLLGIVPALGLVLYIALEQHDLAATAAHKEALRLAHLVTEDHKELIEETEGLLIAMAQLPSVRNRNSAECSEFFKALLKHYHDDYTNLAAFGLDGNMFCSTIPLTRPLNAAHEPWFRQAVQSRDFTFSEYRIGRVSGKPQVTLTYPVLGYDGQVQALVLAGLDLARMNHLIAKVQLPAGSVATLIDRNGTILAHYPDPKKWVGQSFPNAPLFRITMKQREGKAESAGLDGISRLYAFTHLGVHPQYMDVSVIVGIPKKVVFAQGNWVLMRNLISLGLVGLLAIAVAWFGGNLSIVNPLSSLAIATRRLAAGDLSVRTGPSYQDGELGELQHAFDEMADSLEAFRRDVTLRNEELATLNLVAATVSQSLELQKVLEDGLDKVLEIMRLSHGEVLLFDAESESIVPRIYRGISSQFALETQAFSVGEGIPGLVAQLERPVLIEDDLPTDPRFLRRSLAAREGLQSMVSVPLRSKRRVVGILDLFSPNSLPLTPERLRLLVAIGDQIGVAVENARMLEELKAKEQMRLQLLEKVISAQEDERKRVARELHDETSQSLTSLMVGLKVLEATTSFQEVREKAAELRALSREILRDVHELAFQLRPSLLDHLGLPVAIQRLTEDYTQKMGLHIDLQISGFEESRVPSTTEIALYRLIQEALTNVAKHAEAKNVSVILRRGDSKVLAIVEDNGKGFHAAEIMASTSEDKKMGLFGMEERAALIGGKLTIESTPGNGTTVFVEVPV